MIDTAMAIPLWTYAAFLGAAFVLYLTPGADMMFTIASGLRGGPRVGVAAAAGVSLGIMTHALIAAAGLAVLLLTYPLAYDVIRYAGAAYLAWLAWHAWRSNAEDLTRTDLSAHKGRAELVRAFRRGYVTNILNPKVALFVLAFLPQFTDAALGPVWQQIVILGAILTLGGLITVGAIGACAGFAAARMTRAAGLMGRLSAVVFGGLALRIALD